MNPNRAIRYALDHGRVVALLGVVLLAFVAAPLVATAAAATSPTAPATPAVASVSVPPPIPGPGGLPGPIYRTVVVWPNGMDDTFSLQNALNSCVGAVPMCQVQLVAGVYHTRQLQVYGFEGNLVGAGMGQTTLQALPNLPSAAVIHNDAQHSFWTGLPSVANPWPALLTFVNGTIAISGLTLSDPFTAPVHGDYISGHLYTSLYAGILVTGAKAQASVDHVAVVGTTGDVGTNFQHGVLFQGLLNQRLMNGLVKPVLLGGTLSVSHSQFTNVNGAVWFSTLSGATGIASANTFTGSSTPLGFSDLSSSSLVFSGNQAPNVVRGAGVTGTQAEHLTGLQASSVVISGNAFGMSQGAVGVRLNDLAGIHTLTAVVQNNLFATAVTVGSYNPLDPAGYSVVSAIHLKALAVAQNVFTGGGSAAVYVLGIAAVVTGNVVLSSFHGVWLASSVGAQITANTVQNSHQWGIAVTGGASNTLVQSNTALGSGLLDLYWDQTGSGNLWIANHYVTSTPLTGT